MRRQVALALVRGRSSRDLKNQMAPNSRMVRAVYGGRVGGNRPVEKPSTMLVYERLSCQNIQQRKAALIQPASQKIAADCKLPMDVLVPDLMVDNLALLGHGFKKNISYRFLLFFCGNQTEQATAIHKKLRPIFQVLSSGVG